MATTGTVRTPKKPASLGGRPTCVIRNDDGWRADLVEGCPSCQQRHSFLLGDELPAGPLNVTCPNASEGERFGISPHYELAVIGIDSDL